MRAFLLLSPILLPGLVLAGCATPDTTYPSLAIREGERVTGTFEPAPAPPPAPPSGVSGDQLARLRSDVTTAHRGFLAAADDASARVSAARGMEIESESYSLALVALGTLETRRSEAMVALAELDRLFIAAQLEGADTAPIGAIREEVERMVAAEDQQIAALSASLGR